MRRALYAETIVLANILPPATIHVKVQAPNGPVLTSQIYFPGVAANDRDSIFDPALLADVQDTADGKVATFNFVVNAP
jgi:protocatechuate 3,4-dioxygenase beta subunit